jgi:epoxyqueuosine reductase
MTENLGTQILGKAREMGAIMAGIASVDLLRESPSHQVLRKLGLEIDGIGSLMRMPDMRDVKWPSTARSAVVIGVSHPEDKPELDWADASSNTLGNRILIDINRQLAAWIEERLGTLAYKLAYSVEMGGAFLKDAAFLAGLGCVGRNNLIITPELGPQVRLRAMLLEMELEPTGPIAFDPCAGCGDLCRKACPQSAFESIVHSPQEAGTEHLPGRDGSFSRSACFQQMVIDVENGGVGLDEASMDGADAEQANTTEITIKYCRRCELACPIGKPRA